MVSIKGDLHARRQRLTVNAWTVVDVREPHEFVAGHIPNALNMPMSGFDPRELPQGKPVVLICPATQPGQLPACLWAIHATI